MKSLNTRAKLTIQKLYEAMYDPQYMIEEGIYARIDNNPACNFVTVEKEKTSIENSEIIYVTVYGKQEDTFIPVLVITFMIRDKKIYPIALRNNCWGVSYSIYEFNAAGKPIYINLELQKKLCLYAERWLCLISQQQKSLKA